MSESPVRPFVVACVAAAALGVVGFAVSSSNFSAVPRLGFAIAHADEAPKIFHGVGVVTAVDPDSGMLTVDHGDIPGLMDAMEMAYKVGPPELSAGLRKGDTIAFGVDGRTYTIVEIKKVPKP